MRTSPFLLGVALILFSCQSEEKQETVLEHLDKIPVFVFTDINNAKGDPDDKQSLIHLLWYADVLDIRGFVPDRWNGYGFEATMEGIAEYEKDFQERNWGERGYPVPDTVRNRVAQNDRMAIQMLYHEAMSSPEPLYVLIWGNMLTFRQALFTYPEIANKVRVLTIGTGRKYGPKDEVAGEDCNVSNWNGKGGTTSMRILALTICGGWKTTGPTTACLVGIGQRICLIPFLPSVPWVPISKPW